MNKTHRLTWFVLSLCAYGSILASSPAQTPYFEAFDTEQAWKTFTVIDANGDGLSLGDGQWVYRWNWIPDLKEAYITADEAMGMDDWLITPPIELQGGKTYEVSFDIRCKNSTYPERIEVLHGPSATVEGMTSTLIEPTIITNTTPIRISALLTTTQGSLEHIGFHAISDIWTDRIAIDNLSITEYAPPVDCDLSIRLLTPTHVDVDEPFQVQALVTNLGAKSVNGYVVTIKLDNEEIAAFSEQDLMPNETKTFTVPQLFGIMSPMKGHYAAQVSCDGDQDLANNATPVSLVHVRKPATLPSLEIEAEALEGGNYITWQAPDLDRHPKRVNENFENANSWTPYPDGWSIIDQDGGLAGSLSDPYSGASIMLPNWEKGVDPSTWQVFDSGDTGVYDFKANYRLVAHSGDKYMASIWNYSGEENDDWLISPRLSGTAQTIRFYAKASSNTQSLRVLYSLDGKDAEDFIDIPGAARGQVEGEGQWTLVDNVELPDGTTYFAIRHTGCQNSMLMIDDVSFTDFGAPQGLRIKGYRIYRDGELLDTTADNEYFDDDCIGTHSYAVAVDYGDQGISAASNLVILEGISTSIPQQVTAIMETKPVYNLQGMMISPSASLMELRDLPAGIYIYGGRKIINH